MKDFDALPELDITATDFLGDPPAALQFALEQAPIWRSARGLEVLPYRSCLTASRDRRLWVNNLRDVEALGFPEGPVMDFKRRMILGQGFTKDRTAIRQTLGRTVGRVGAEDMRPAIRSIIHALLDDIVAHTPSGPAEFLNAFCVLLPARLYCYWVGAPDADAPFAARLSEAVMRVFLQDPSDVPIIVEAYEELFPYIERQMAQARQTPQDNLLGLLMSEVDRGVMTPLQAQDFAVMLLEASIENSAQQLALVLGAVLGDAEIKSQLLRSPNYIGPAVNEAIRLNSRVGRLKRYTREAVSIDGVMIPPDTSVILGSWAAHRDATVFQQPELFRLDRNNPAANLTFGGGNFSCLGQFVALIEIEETLKILNQRFPDARLCEFKTDFSPVRKACQVLTIALMP
ncbi:MAG: cytochrome P450 [Pseudomonadota bacterium]